LLPLFWYYSWQFLAVEVVVLVLDKAAKTAKVLKWSTEAVIV